MSFDITDETTSLKIDENHTINKQRYICKEEIDLDWDYQEGELCAHGSDNNVLDMESMDIDSSYDTNSKICDFNKKDFQGEDKFCEIQNFCPEKHKEQITNFNPIIVIEKLPEHVIKKSLHSKENIHSKTQLQENDRYSIKNLCIRFCENCKKTVKSDLKPTSCCPKCNSVLTYKCKKCSKHAISYTGMLYHLKSTCQTQGHYYKCPGCPYKSAFKIRIKEHVKKLHKDLPASSMEIIATQNLQKDLKSTELHVHKCIKCGKQFRQLSYLNQHLKACDDFEYRVDLLGTDAVKNESQSDDLIHQSDPTPDTLNVIKMAKLYCEKCDERTSLNDSVYSSKKCINCKVKLLFECSKCKKQYTSGKGIVYHLNAKCATREMFFCSKCNYQSPVKRLLTQHYKTVHESSLVECPKCKTVLKNKGTLVKHLEYCGKELYLNCDKCSYKSNNPTIFRSHLKRHVYSEKKIEATCPKCSKKLKNQFSLNCHLNYCNKERRFQCTMCAYKNHYKSKLRDHMVRIHFNGVKKFPACHKCGVTFSYKYCADAHLRYCGTSKPHFQCDYCPYKCDRKSTLKSHIVRMHLKKINKSDESDVDVEN